MTPHSPGRWRILAALFAAITSLWLTVGVAQEPADAPRTGARAARVEPGAERGPVVARAGTRAVEQPVAPPGIDRGLHDEDLSGPRSGRVSASQVRPAEYEPGKVIVKLREDSAPDARASVLREARGTRMSRPSHANFDVIAIDKGADAEAVATALAKRADVEYAQASYRIHPYFAPNDPLYSRQWNFPLINLETGWDINQGGGPTVVVAVLDTGVAFRDVILQFDSPSQGRVSVPFAVAPELAGSNRFVAPYDFIWGDSNAVDMDGHGTHVSGTIGQNTNNGVGVAGIAFNVRIMPVKCISTEWDDIFDSPFVGTDEVVARAIRYAADNGAQVINLSLGRNDGPPAPVVGDAMRYAVSKGAFIAVAGGNDYEDGNPVERLAEQAEPIQGAVVVGAVGRDRNRAYYSGVKPYIEIAAPGGNSRVGGAAGAILQQTYDLSFTDPATNRVPRFDVFAYLAFQGTSMATPHVSGLAALLISQGVTSPAAVEAALEHFADDLGTPGRDESYGYGLINARTTLRGLGILK
jgi:serine protease